MKCSDVFLHICENLDQGLKSPQCSRIKKHLDGCPDCKAYLSSLKKTVGLYRTMPTPKVTASAHNKLFKSIKMGSLPTSPERRATSKGSAAKL